MGLRPRFYVLWPRFKNAASDPFFCSEHKLSYTNSTIIQTLTTFILFSFPKQMAYHLVSRLPQMFLFHFMHTFVLPLIKPKIKLKQFLAMSSLISYSMTSAFGCQHWLANLASRQYTMLCRDGTSTPSQGGLKYKNKIIMKLQYIYIF